MGYTPHVSGRKEPDPSDASTVYPWHSTQQLIPCSVRRIDRVFANVSNPLLPVPCHQDAGNLLSSACAIDTSDTDLPYNAACAFALSGDHTSCFRALSEFCRRLTLTLTIAAAASSGGVSSSKRDAARWSLREVEDDVDLESVREAGWFIDLLRGTNATLVGGP